MSIWKFPKDKAAEAGWRVDHSPHTFATRDRHAPHPVLAPLVADVLHGKTYASIAGWHEAFGIGPFTRVECNGSITLAEGVYKVDVNGFEVIQLTRETTDLFEALDLFANAISNARSVIKGKKMAMGIFEGHEETYERPVSPSLFAELTERGMRKMVKDTDEKWRQEHYSDWGSW